MYLYWLYYVQILLMILHILMYFLGGLHVALASVLEPKKKVRQSNSQWVCDLLANKVALAKLPHINKGGVFLYFMCGDLACSLLNILATRCVISCYMLEWKWKEKHKIGTLKTRELRDSALSAYVYGGISQELYLYYVKKQYKVCIIMNYNMSIYRLINPRLLVQVGVNSGLLRQANMSNISLTPSLRPKTKCSIKA